MGRYYIGIDFGGTSIRAAVYKIEDKTYSPVKKKPFFIYDTPKEEYKQNIIYMIKQMVSDNSDNQLAGIGISMAPNFNRETGHILTWPNNPKWKGFEILSSLFNEFRVPIILEDDGNCAALGEQLYGKAIGQENFIYVNIGTGIGCGIILHNQLLTGEHGLAGELGHIKIADCNNRCSCGGYGCLQTVASGLGIKRNFRKQLTGRQKKQYAAMEVEEIAALAKAGNFKAKEVFDKAGHRLGTVLANLVMLFDVPLIVIGGGLINNGSLITAAIEDDFQKTLNKRRKVEIKYSKNSDDIGVYGAISLLLRTNGGI